MASRTTSARKAAWALVAGLALLAPVVVTASPAQAAAKTKQDLRTPDARDAAVVLHHSGHPVNAPGATAVGSASEIPPAIATGGRSGVALVIIGVLCSVITAFVYVRLIVLMYFTEPAGGGVVAHMPSAMTTIALTVGLVVVSFSSSMYWPWSAWYPNEFMLGATVPLPAAPPVSAP